METQLLGHHSRVSVACRRDLVGDVIVKGIGSKRRICELLPAVAKGSQQQQARV